MGKINETLAELILINLTKIKTDNHGRKTMSNKRVHKTASRHKSSIAAIVANVIMNSLKTGEKADEDQSKDNLENTAIEEPENKEKKDVHGGYGTIKHYAGMPAYTSYANYDKIWSHLGRFRAYGAYGRAENGGNAAMDNGESAREMVSKDTMEKAAKHFKYFVRGEILGDIGFIPPFGSNISSEEWEKYRLMSKMSIYQPLLKLKWTIA